MNNDLQATVAHVLQQLYPGGTADPLQAGRDFRILADEVGVSERCISLIAASLGYWGGRVGGVERAVSKSRVGERE